MKGRTNVGGGGGAVSVILVSTSDFSGMTVNCSNGSTFNKNKTFGADGTATFKVVLVGEYTLTVVSGGDTYSTTVNVDVIGQQYDVVLDAIPIGATVEPINDVDILLRCAGINGKGYTSISQLIADSASMLAVVSDSNAVDYLIRSTDFASAMTADSGTMTLIGNNDYCTESLLEDDTWFGAICDSEQFEKVLNVKVPTMTSDTKPSGRVTASSYRSVTGGNYYPWYAFDGVTVTNNNDHFWHTTNACPQWIQYEFASAVCIKMVRIYTYAQNYYTQHDFVIKASTDGTNFTDLTETQKQSDEGQKFAIKNKNKYKYYRFYVSKTYTSANCPRIAEIQYYGRA